MHLAVCTCSYDTAHESVTGQLEEKLAGLRAAFPRGGPVRVSLWIADDAAGSAGGAFGADIQAFMARSDEAIHVVSCAPRGRGSQKGRAVRTAVAAALGERPEALAYVNLNAKVDARYLGPALAPLQKGAADVVSGSRSPRDGGQAIGSGTLGVAKSRAWAAIAQAALPELSDISDPSSPLKMMTTAAAELVVAESNVDGLGFDVEWLCLWKRAGLRIAKVPIVWRQRPGSRPPWELIPEMLWTLASSRRRFHDSGSGNR